VDARPSVAGSVSISTIASTPASVSAPAVAPGDPLTVRDAVTAFLAHCRFEKNLSDKTLKAYATDLAQFAYSEERRDASVLDLGKPLLREHVRRLFERYREKSVKRKIATLKAFFTWLEREELIPTNPMRMIAVRFKETRRVPPIIPFSDFEVLFRHVYALLESLPAGSLAHRVLVRDVAVLETIFATGARISEVCNLRRGDVDLHDGSVKILGKGRKERVIQLSNASTIRAMRQYEALWSGFATGEFYFLNRRGGRLTEQSVRTFLRSHSARAGLTVRVRPHMIRHSVATLLLDEGVDIRHIQHLLGHSSIVTTQIYTHVSDRTQRAILSAKHPRRHLHGAKIG
jgi:integrase/recombinase XerD